MIHKKTFKVKTTGTRGDMNNPLRANYDKTKVPTGFNVETLTYVDNDKYAYLTIWCSDNVNGLPANLRKGKTEIDTVSEQLFPSKKALVNSSFESSGSISKNDVVIDE